jgi:hypothetical protein
MLDLGVTISCSSVSPLHASLWRCETCNSFVSIHSAKMIEQAFCPVCKDSPLELCCGSFQSILGLPFANA